MATHCVFVCKVGGKDVLAVNTSIVTSNCNTVQLVLMTVGHGSSVEMVNVYLCGIKRINIISLNFTNTE